MNKIYGVGEPSKIRPAGTEYIDTKTGLRYNQNIAPHGNSWTLIDDGNNTNSISTSTGIESVLYYLTKELTASEILSSLTSGVYIGSLPKNSNGTYFISSVNLYFTGTSITANTNYNIDITDGSVLLNSIRVAGFYPAKHYFTSNTIMSGYVGGGTIQSISNTVDLYFHIYNGTPIGGDGTSLLKIYITYLYF